MEQRLLGRSGIKVSALGLGCWAIGGPFLLDGKPDGWGNVDDDESIRAIHRALDLGINFLDTADAYGAGHSERVIGQALAGRRHEAVIATKFGYIYDEDKREVTGTNVTPKYIRWACEQSLRRLNTDYIDLYQLHCGASPEEAQIIFDTLDDLVREGKIRAFGWSTADPSNVQAVAAAQHGVAIQHPMNVLNDASDMLSACIEQGMASVVNSPLVNGLLTGKYRADHQFAADDFRAAGHEWTTAFEDGRPKQSLMEQIDAIREQLTMQGHTLAQGALAWVWAKSDQTIPIPGFKTVAQVEENCAAIQLGPLPAAQMQKIDQILGRSSVTA